MRIVIKTCELCETKYGYMVSGYGVSPGRWNEAHGVGHYNCAECADKVTPLREKIWRLRDRVNSSIRNIEHMMDRPDMWMSMNRFGDAIGKMMRRDPMNEVFKMGPVEPTPMKKPSCSILFYDGRYDDGST